VWRYLRDPMFSRFDTIPECDRQTDTHRHTTTAYTALSIASRGKKYMRIRTWARRLCCPRFVRVPRHDTTSSPHHKQRLCDCLRIYISVVYGWIERFLEHGNCLPVADSLYKRKRTFLCKYISSSSVLFRLFASTAAVECGKVQSV